ncbi:MAG: carbon-nitrogen hydrolase family protein [Alphaproteobacteria bacterium]
MGEIFTAACLQLNSSAVIAENIATVTALARQAASQGARFITTPEVTSIVTRLKEDVIRASTFAQDEDPAVAAFRALAAELRVWLLIGSIPVRVADTKVANRCFLFGPKGQIAASYDKIHMFDVDLPNGERYRESKSFVPGQKAVLYDLPWGRLGLSICYDLRFPHLYRTLAKARADFLTIPAAFTKTTGEAHWHILLRARAIETGCFVLAPAQTGTHSGDGRKTYGHSLIIAPWGEILADAGEDVGFILAEIDPERVAKARAQVPALTHDVTYELDNMQSG